MPKPDAIFEPAPDVVFRDLGGESVLLHLASATYFGLNEVGTRIWELIAERQPLREVCDRLADEFDEPRDQIERDVSALVDQMLAKDLLRVAG